MRKHSTVRRSRRAPPLKASDYDHEIGLVDHAAEAATPQAISPQPTDTIASSSEDRPEAEQRPSSSSLQAPSGIHSPRDGTTSSSAESKKSNKSSKRSRSRRNSSGKAVIPTVHVEAALGQLDPPNWTNAAHKPSPTSVDTAQVPDPSWVWAWPEWHVNKGDGVDENGWEYSFMFAKMFSWHPPAWWNSCVRRRAWIRQRVKGDPVSSDPHMLSTEYFTVRPSTETARSDSRASVSVASWVSANAGEKPDIDDIEDLMAILRRSRIDREKLDAVENFLEHGEEDLSHLQHKMHDIMGLFIFQASRRVLLAKLNQVYEQALEELKKNDTGRLQRRSNSLKAAIEHADEECRRLEYWSDIKDVVREGTTEAATDKCRGWDESWRGVDDSGPPEPDTSKDKA
ncbi:hypothetical protein SLS53_006266 [Cytospora paraplurivora]|uniref:Meiotically up-regulated 65 protein n=1 Tax=Cytospora paraplurivora TaxID=2898453 RepID=A0AAN9YEX9_9PEZI